MLVDAKKLKLLRLEKNWTQQHLAEVCGLSLRTIQRVEKDGVASNETVGAYAAIFELNTTDFTLSNTELERTDLDSTAVSFRARSPRVLFFGGIILGMALGISLTAAFLQ